MDMKKEQTMPKRKEAFLPFPRSTKEHKHIREKANT
jgi:hypothetical protein